MYSNCSFSSCHGNGRQKLIKDRGKWSFLSCHFRNTKVRSTPNQHTSGNQYGYQNLPCTFLNQFMPILYDYNILGSEVQSFENDDRVYPKYGLK